MSNVEQIVVCLKVSRCVKIMATLHTTTRRTRSNLLVQTNIINKRTNTATSNNSPKNRTCTNQHGKVRRSEWRPCSAGLIVKFHKPHVPCCHTNTFETAGCVATAKYGPLWGQHIRRAAVVSPTPSCICRRLSLIQELLQVEMMHCVFAWLGRSRTAMIPHATGCWPQAHLHNMHAPFSCSARTESANCECIVCFDLSTFPLGLDDLTRWHEESSPIVRKRCRFDMFR